MHVLQAFPIGSPLVSYISKAILNVTQDQNKMQELEIKYFGHGTKCEDPDTTLSSDDDTSLSVHSFSGLFIITGIASVFAYLIHLVKIRSATNVIHPDSPLSLWSIGITRAEHGHMDLPNLQARVEVSVNNGNHSIQSPPTVSGQEAIEMARIYEDDASQ